MKKSVLPSPDLRNPFAHLALAAGLHGSFEALFAELPAEDGLSEPEDDGLHEPLCPCWRCDTSQVWSELDEDDARDMALDIAEDRCWS